MNRRVASVLDSASARFYSLGAGRAVDVSRSSGIEEDIAHQVHPLLFRALDESQPPDEDNTLNSTRPSRSSEAMISFMENRLEWHYKPLTDDLYQRAVEELGAR